MVFYPCDNSVCLYFVHCTFYVCLVQLYFRLCLLYTNINIYFTCETCLYLKCVLYVFSVCMWCMFICWTLSLRFMYFLMYLFYVYVYSMCFRWNGNKDVYFMCVWVIYVCYVIEYYPYVLCIVCTGFYSVLCVLYVCIWVWVTGRGSRYLIVRVCFLVYISGNGPDTDIGGPRKFLRERDKKREWWSKVRTLHWGSKVRPPTRWCSSSIDWFWSLTYPRDG